MEGHKANDDRFADVTVKMSSKDERIVITYADPCRYPRDTMREHHRAIAHRCPWRNKPKTRESKGEYSILSPKVKVLSGSEIQGDDMFVFRVGSRQDAEMLSLVIGLPQAQIQMLEGSAFIGFPKHYSLDWEQWLQTAAESMKADASGVYTLSLVSTSRLVNTPSLVNIREYLRNQKQANAVKKKALCCWG